MFVVAGRTNFTWVKTTDTNWRWCRFQSSILVCRVKKKNDTQQNSEKINDNVIERMAIDERSVEEIARHGVRTAIEQRKKKTRQLTAAMKLNKRMKTKKTNSEMSMKRRRSAQKCEKREKEKNCDRNETKADREQQQKTVECCVRFCFCAAFFVVFLSFFFYATTQMSI